LKEAKAPAPSPVPDENKESKESGVIDARDPSSPSGASLPTVSAASTSTSTLPSGATLHMSSFSSAPDHLAPRSQTTILVFRSTSYKREPFDSTMPYLKGTSREIQTIIGEHGKALLFLLENQHVLANEIKSQWRHRDTLKLTTIMVLVGRATIIEDMRCLVDILLGIKETLSQTQKLIVDVDGINVRYSVEEVIASATAPFLMIDGSSSSASSTSSSAMSSCSSSSSATSCSSSSSTTQNELIFQAMCGIVKEAVGIVTQQWDS